MPNSFLASRIRDAIDRHPTHTAASLGPALGKSRGYGHSLLSGKHDPSWTTVLAICEELSLAPADLIEPSATLELERKDPVTQLVEKQAEALLNRITSAINKKMSDRGSALSIEELVTWWFQNDGALVSMGQFAENVDIYHVPDLSDGMLQPFRLGANSLACQTLTSCDHGRLLMFLDTLTPDQLDLLQFSYREAEDGPKTAVSSILVDMPDMAAPVNLDYFRLLLPVRDAQDNRYIMNYSRPIERRGEVLHEVSVFDR